MLTRRYDRRSPMARVGLGRRARATLRRERATRVLVRYRTPDERHFRWFIRVDPAD